MPKFKEVDHTKPLTKTEFETLADKKVVKGVTEKIETKIPEKVLTGKQFVSKISKLRAARS